MPFSPRYLLATKKAHDFIKENSIKIIPVDPFELAELMDISLKTYTQISKEQNQSLEEIIRSFGSRDGVAILSDGVPGIIYNDTEIPSRVRFTLIHEIGHIYLGHLDDFEETSLSRKNLTNSNYEVLERETNCFARNVLSPLPVVESIEYKNKNKLAELFQISFDAAKARLDFFSIDIRNTKKNSYSSTKSLLNPFIFKLHNTHACLHCGKIHLFYNPKFCSICGNSGLAKIENPIGVEDKMIYSKIETNENNKPYQCPRCENSLLENGVFCKVCGIYIFNKCTGLYQGETDQQQYQINWQEHQQGCNVLLDGDARFCSNCGSTSTYFEDNLLKEWLVELKEENKETEQVSQVTQEIDVPW